MALQYFRSTHPDDLAGPFDCDAVNALVTAGAFVALADGRVQTVERDEVVNYIHRRRFGATRQQITYLFDERTRQLQEANFASVVLEALRPVPSMSLTSDVTRIAQRVAVADGNVHPDEAKVIRLIRLITMSFPEPKIIEPHCQIDDRNI
jgi:tellurite resistance protein TerB